nr:vacuolar protein 8 [Ipomoea batatas]
MVSRRFTVHTHLAELSFAAANDNSLSADEDDKNVLIAVAQGAVPEIKEKIVTTLAKISTVDSSKHGLPPKLSSALYGWPPVVLEMVALIMLFRLWPLELRKKNKLSSHCGALAGVLLGDLQAGGLDQRK